MIDDIARTLSILRELAQGKQLTLPEVGTLVMGEDMTVGFAIVDANTGATSVGPASELTLSALVRQFHRWSWLTGIPEGDGPPRGRRTPHSETWPLKHGPGASREGQQATPNGIGVGGITVRRVLTLACTSCNQQANPATDLLHPMAGLRQTGSVHRARRNRIPRWDCAGAGESYHRIIN